MVALYTASICEFFVERLRSGLWSGSFSVSPPSPIPIFFFHCFISVTAAWNRGSWLGCGDLPATGTVFYLGAGWPQWKPLGIPGTHLPLKRLQLYLLWDKLRSALEHPLFPQGYPHFLKYSPAGLHSKIIIISITV